MCFSLSLGVLKALAQLYSLWSTGATKSVLVLPFTGWQDRAVTFVGHRHFAYVRPSSINFAGIKTNPFVLHMKTFSLTYKIIFFLLTLK